MSQVGESRNKRAVMKSRNKERIIRIGGIKRDHLSDKIKSQDLHHLISPLMALSPFNLLLLHPPVDLEKVKGAEVVVAGEGGVPSEEVAADEVIVGVVVEDVSVIETTGVEKMEEADVCKRAAHKWCEHRLAIWNTTFH
jgi:hypothetical protein